MRVGQQVLTLKISIKVSFDCNVQSQTVRMHDFFYRLILSLSQQQMKRVLCAFTVNPDFVEFALPEMKALLQGCPVPLATLLKEELDGREWPQTHEINHQLFRNFPFLVLNVPDFEIHRPFFEQFCRKAVMIYKTVLLLASGKNYEEMLANRDEELLQRLCRNEEDPVLCDFFSRNRVVVREEQVARIHKVLGGLDVKGKVNFKQPKLRYQLIEEHEWYQQHHKTELDATLKHVFFGLELSCNKIATAKFNSPYELKNRIYLGPTSTDNDLAFMMCNQALVGEGSLVIDPFVGTGGLLIPPASKGAITFGSDLDIRVINGYAVGRINKRSPYYSAEKKFEVFTPKINLSFEQYGFPIPNIIRVDCTKMALHSREFFDAIITDPPYGIRAMSRTVTGRKQEQNEEEKPEEGETIEETLREKEQQGEIEAQKGNLKEEGVEEPEKKEETKELTEQEIKEKAWKLQKRRHLKQNKKKRQEQLPEEEKQFKKDLLNRLNRERVDNWEKFDKGKIETTERQKIFEGLLAFALNYLRPQGRLVFLFPVYEEEVYLGAASLPPHPGFALVDLSQNKMSKGNSRILVTLQKL